ncbi:MAG: hypothetical protein FWH14_02765 [Oscillospiraceae bacterium]|nr:hypothetical protein [Oscillospiraceae bacterium]
MVGRDDRLGHPWLSQGRVFFSWLPQIPWVFLALPLGELSAVTPTERAGRVRTPVRTVGIKTPRLCQRMTD